MCCAKVATKFIEDPKSRNVTFNKRKQGLKKKAYEFSTLCGVDTCMICFKEDDGHGLSKPLTWPEEASEVERIIKRYKRVSDEEKEKRNVDLSSFLENKKKKMEEELIRRRRRESGKMPMYPCWDGRLDDWPEESLRELANQLDVKMEDVRNRITLLKDNQRFLQLTEEIEVPKLSVQLQPLPISCSIKPHDRYYSTPEFHHNPAAFEFSFNPNTSSGGKFNYDAVEFLHNPVAFESSFMPNTSSGGKFNYEADEFLHNQAVFKSSFMPNTSSVGKFNYHADEFLRNPAVFKSNFMPNTSTVGKFSYDADEFPRNPSDFKSNFMPNTSTVGKFNYDADGLPSLLFTNLSVGMLPFINPGFGMLQNNNEVVAYNPFHQEGCVYGPQHFGQSDFRPSNSLPYQTLLMHPRTDHLHHGLSEFNVRPRNDWL